LFRFARVLGRRRRRRLLRVGPAQLFHPLKLRQDPDLHGLDVLHVVVVVRSFRLFHRPPGTDVIILKIVLPKTLAKNWRFWLKLLLHFAKIK
jgi:hypothetical protein